MLKALTASAVRMDAGWPAGMAYTTPPGTRTVRQPRILVVDDDQLVRKSLQRVLHGLNYETEVAADGHEALAKLALDVDLVMLDASMPSMDGFQLTRRIRESSQYGDLPIIMVT
ncbi:MAG TPA: response regulator, partial [Gemmatimonadaceae bacterium]